MAINKDSNLYTIVFAFILVAIVGGVLAFVSQTLKPLQQENLKNEKKQNILNSIPSLKSIERKDAGEEFGKYVKKRIILDHEGNQIPLLVPSTEPPEITISPARCGYSKLHSIRETVINTMNYDWKYKYYVIYEHF